MQARVVAVVTTDKWRLRRGHYSTRLDAAGRLACSYYGYVSLVAVNSSDASVRRALRPVLDLLTRRDRHRPSTVVSRRASDFDDEPVTTVSRSAGTDQHA